MNAHTTFLMLYQWGITFRVYGYGLVFRVADKDEVILFSERYGYKKVYRFCGLVFMWLKP